MVYINAASTISHQAIFKKKNFKDDLQVLQGIESVEPVAYKEYIDGGLLRRMSKLLRMGVACAKECLQTNTAAAVDPDGIIVGTGLGCLSDTEKFLETNLTVSGLLPPTSFIQSTHNTIAGQISLSLGNHNYNMTHTQNSISFEHALIDALMWLGIGKKTILVGAADEQLELFDTISSHFFRESPNFTSGVSFFQLSTAFSSTTMAKVVDVEVYTGTLDPQSLVLAFLEKNKVHTELKSVFYQPALGGDQLDFSFLPTISVCNTLAYSGVYATASAFGLHLAADQLATLSTGTRMLICNHLNPQNLGLILIESVEA